MFTMMSLPAVWPVGCLAHLAWHCSDGLPEGVSQLQTRGPAWQPDPREGPAARPLLAPQLWPQDRSDLETRGRLNTHTHVHSQSTVQCSRLPWETPMFAYVDNQNELAFAPIDHGLNQTEGFKLSSSKVIDFPSKNLPMVVNSWSVPLCYSSSVRAALQHTQP